MFTFILFYFVYCFHDILSLEMKFYFYQNDRNEVTPVMK